MGTRVIFLLGAIQSGVGAFIALRPVVGSGAPLTSSRALDLAFAAYFLIRGAMNIRNAVRARRVLDAATPVQSPDP